MYLQGQSGGGTGYPCGGLVHVLTSPEARTILIVTSELRRENDR